MLGIEDQIIVIERSDPVAWIALGLTLALALWEIVRFVYYEGPRIVVTMNPGIYEPEISVQQWVARRPESAMGTRQGTRFSLEVAVVRVENRGRTATTVSAPHFQFKRPPWQRPFRKPRRLVQYRPLKFDAAHTDVLRTRLEPGEHAPRVRSRSRSPGELPSPGRGGMR